MCSVYALHACPSKKTSIMKKNIPLQRIISLSSHSPRRLLFDKKEICSFFCSKTRAKLNSIIYREGNRHCVVVNLIAVYEEGEPYITVTSDVEACNIELMHGE